MSNKAPDGTFDPAAENLWTALTSRVYSKDYADQDTRVLNALAWSSRYAGQELSLEATKDGWVIRVFSCYGPRDPEDDYWAPESEIVITIPHDREKPPSVEERPGL